MSAFRRRQRRGVTLQICTGGACFTICIGCVIFWLSVVATAGTGAFFLLRSRQSGPGEHKLVSSYVPMGLPLKIVAKSDGNLSIRPVSRYQTPFGTFAFEVQQEQGVPSLMVDNQEFALGETDFEYSIPERLKLAWNPAKNLLTINVLGEYRTELEKALGQVADSEPK